MTVRVGSARDVDAALAVWQAVERARSQPPGAARTTRMRTALRAPTSLLLVTGEPVAGLLLVELVDRRLEVSLLCVAPEAQGAGVARELAGALLERFPQVATWSEHPAVCEALGLSRTGREREDGAVELSR